VAVAGWILDKSAAARADHRSIGPQLDELAGSFYMCPVGELEQLYSARSAIDYNQLKAELHTHFGIVIAPPDLLERALALQQDLAHHHGMWHRTPIAELLIAETAIHHGLGVVHVDGGFERIAEVRHLVVRRLKAKRG